MWNRTSTVDRNTVILILCERLFQQKYKTPHLFYEFAYGYRYINLFVVLYYEVWQSKN